MEIIPLPPVPYHTGSPGILFLRHLTHQTWSHYQSLYLATNHTLVRILTWCFQPPPVRPLLLSL